MADSQLWNSLGYAEKCFIAAKASMNGSALSSEGKSIKMLDCGIDTMKISTLGEYMAKRNGKLDLRDDEKLAKRFVIPVILPNGQEVEVIVNRNGQDEVCIFKDEAGNKGQFQLTPRARKEISSKIPDNLKDYVLEKEIEKCFYPNNLDEYTEKIRKDEFIPKNKKHATDIMQSESNEYTKDELEKIDEGKDDIEQNKDIPDEVRDIVAKICSENDLDVKQLLEILEVPPQDINKKLENTGIKDNDGKVYCLRFKNGEGLNGRVVMAQSENKIVDNRTYDDYINDYMSHHGGYKGLTKQNHEHDKISYTDLDGHTISCEIMREPRDMNCSEKDILLNEMKKLDENTKIILNSDMPIENKTQEIIKINSKRLDMLKERGISVPTVSSEIKADIEISEDVHNKVTRNVKELEEHDDEIEAFEVPGKRTR